MKKKESKRNIIINLLTSGTFDQYDIGKRSRIMFLNSLSLVGAAFLYFFTIREYLNQELIFSIVIGICAIIMTFTFIFARVTKMFVISNIIVTCFTFLLFGFLTVSTGQEVTGVLWASGYSLVALFLMGIVGGSIFTITFIIGIALCFFIPSLKISTFSDYYKFSLFASITFVYSVALTYERVRRNTHRKLVESNTELSQITNDLKLEKHQTDSIMNNVQEGIFLINRNLNMESTYSMFLKDIFNIDDFEGRTFESLFTNSLGEKELSSLHDFLELFFSKKVNQDLMKRINPLERVAVSIIQKGESKEHHLSFLFSQIEQGAGNFSILGVARDITEEVLLEQQLKEDEITYERNMENLFQIIHVDAEMMKDFINDTEIDLDHINGLMREEPGNTRNLLNKIYQSVHSIKSNAFSLGLSSFGKKVHEIEDKLKHLISKGSEWKDLLKFTIDLGDLAKDLGDIKQLINRIVSFQGSKILHTEDGIIEKTLHSIISQESQKLGKRINLISKEFASDKIPEKYKKVVKETLVQLVRNSIVHGIEKPKYREECNKHPIGKIMLQLKEKDDSINLIYRDDGAGINLEKIREKAKSFKDFSHIDIHAMEDSKLAGLIFHPGFSTADKESTTAGRGIGMNVVKSNIEKTGGSLKFRFSPGKFSEFRMVFPKK